MTAITNLWRAMFCLFVTLPGLAFSQDAPPAHAHQHPLVVTQGKALPPGSIDGSKTPELIPDSTAYRIFFRALTTDADLARQQAMLGRAQLSPADLAHALAVGAQFESLRATYKQHVKDAIAAAQIDSTKFDQSALAAEQAALGTQVKSLLQARLSKKGMASLDALIQSEKRNMTISPVPDMSGAK
jgi:hypothetical protein